MWPTVFHRLARRCAPVGMRRHVVEGMMLPVFPDSLSGIVLAASAQVFSLSHAQNDAPPVLPSCTSLCHLKCMPRVPQVRPIVRKRQFSRCVRMPVPASGVRRTRRPKTETSVRPRRSPSVCRALGWSYCRRQQKCEPCRFHPFPSSARPFCPSSARARTFAWRVEQRPCWRWVGRRAHRR